MHRFTKHIVNTAVAPTAGPPCSSWSAGMQDRARLIIGLIGALTLFNHTSSVGPGSQVCDVPGAPSDAPGAASPVAPLPRCGCA